jgi:AcrR family transcriptional regulator
MSESNSPEARPYHHGDLRRALVEAARRLLEAEGAAAMSLRAVAREAGVSPAAPYHHFKDKGELMAAVASEGWALLSSTMYQARKDNPDDNLATSITYITFALSRPALYRVMFDSARERESLPFVGIAENDAPYARVSEALARNQRDASIADIELSIAASWCATHGLAEMVGFRQFDHLKEALGGQTPFLRAILTHMGLETHNG